MCFLSLKNSQNTKILFSPYDAATRVSKLRFKFVLPSLRVLISFLARGFLHSFVWMEKIVYILFCGALSSIADSELGFW